MSDDDRIARAGSLKREEAVQVLEQADLAAQAGVPLPPGLRAMAAETKTDSVRRALIAMAERLEAGEPFPVVLEALQPRLSPLMRTVIKQGAEIGRLDTVLHWAAEQSRRKQGLQWQLWSALAYPLVLLCVTFWIGALILMYIVPSFERIFADFGTELPDLTKLVIHLSRISGSTVVRMGVLIAPAIIFGVILLLFVGNTFLPGRRPYLIRMAGACGHWFVSQRWSPMIPLIGPLFRLATLADFSHLLAVFIEIGLPLPKAVRIAGEATGDCWLRIACDRLADEIERGLFRNTAAMADGIPVVILQMLRQTSSTAALTEALHGLAEIYAARVEMNSRFIGVVVEPFILIFTAVGMGTLMLSLFMPLIKLLNDLS